MAILPADPAGVTLGRPARPDLDSRAQIHDMVVRFYREVVFDELLEPVFGQVAEVDWGAHIPKLIDFWCRVLLGQPGYDGFMLGAHQHVHAQQAFEIELFDRWYSLFADVVTDGWEGPYTDAAIDHAARMAATLARRILGVEWSPPASAPVPLAADEWLPVGLAARPTV